MNHTDTEEKDIGERHKGLSDKGKNLSFLKRKRYLQRLEDLAQPLSGRNILKPLAAIKLKESLDRYDINILLMGSSMRRKLFELPLYYRKVCRKGQGRSYEGYPLIWLVVI